MSAEEKLSYSVEAAQRLYLAGRRDGALEEREASTRALRYIAGQLSRDGDPSAAFLEDLALRFEAGEHRKGE